MTPKRPEVRENLVSLYIPDSIVRPLGIYHRYLNFQETTNSFQQWLEQFDMVAELVEWPKHIKVKQLALRLRGLAQAYYQTTLKQDYTT